MSATQRYLDRPRNCSMSARHGTLDVSPFRCGSHACGGGPDCAAIRLNEAAAEVWAEQELRPGREEEETWEWFLGIPIKPFTLGDAYHVLYDLDKRRGNRRDR